MTKPGKADTTQVRIADENWEHELIRNLPLLEDTDEGSMFVVSCKGSEIGKRLPQPVGAVEIKETRDAGPHRHGVTVNVMDTSTLHKLKTRPDLKPTKDLIFPYGSKTPLPLRGIINGTVANGTKKIRTTFHVTTRDTGTLLGCRSSEALQLVYFARQVQANREKSQPNNQEQVRHQGRLQVNHATWCLSCPRRTVSRISQNGPVMPHEVSVTVCF